MELDALDASVDPDADRAWGEACDLGGEGMTGDRCRCDSYAGGGVGDDVWPSGPFFVPGAHLTRLDPLLLREEGLLSFEAYR